MIKTAHQRFALGSTSALALVLGSTGIAQAQETEDTPASLSTSSESRDVTTEEIIVTGTLLRGVAPVGTNVVSVSQEDVVASGAASTNDLLATIPQLSNFNSFPRGTASFGQPIAQTNLRNLGASGGTTTLVLVNGHRLVGSGILQTYVDPTIVPPGIIERVEVIPDGGSSIYGSDAIGGVINFITKKRMDGVEATGKYGFADGYETTDANVTAGKDWGSGSFFVSYAYAWHNNIQGNERDYVTQDNRANGGSDLRVATCRDTNIVANGVNYAMPGLVAGTRNLCDGSDYADIYPREERHSVFASLEQNLSDSLSTNITAYYSTRKTNALTAPLTTNGTITSANPYFQSIAGETSQTVLFDYTSVFGDEGTRNPSKFDSWGITPTFDLDIGGSWKLRGLANYGRSYNMTRENAINATAASAALLGTTTETALNPYDLSATNPALLEVIRNYANISEATQEIAEGRLVLDGTLFTMAGGEVRLAVGYEHHYENIDASIAFGALDNPKRNSVFASRSVDSVYGEVFVPLVGPANATGGIQALELTGSVRYDHYNDVGGTTNPKVGLNYRPTNWMTIRANYGTSFHAPSLADTTGAVDARVTASPVSFNRAAGSPASDFTRPFFYISGGNPDLTPENATTWSVGADIQPDFVEGLTLSVTYYNIDFKNVISVNAGPFTAGQAYYADPTNAAFYILDPTLEETVAFANGARADNFDSFESFYAAYDPYVIYDLRRYNRGQLQQDGLDFVAQFNRPTSFGSINLGVSGTYTLSRRTKESSTADWVDRLKTGSSISNRFNLVANAGGTVGPVTGRATWTHGGGYPVIGDATQTRVSAFNTLDLFFSLDLGKLGVLDDSALTLNIDNVTDEDPPYRNAGSGYANGSTLGRLVALGVRTKF